LKLASTSDKSCLRRGDTAFGDLGDFAKVVAAHIVQHVSPTAGWGVNGRYLLDVVTAASPDIVATASPRWTEVRHAGNLGVKYKPDTFGVAASGSVSYTNDYLSLSAGAQVTKELDAKNLTLLGGSEAIRTGVTRSAGRELRLLFFHEPRKFIR
jgi:hypothetical protein